MARLDWMVQSSLPSCMLGGRRRPQPHWELPARPLRRAQTASRKRSYTYLMHSMHGMRTLRLLLIARAGRLTRIGDRHVLRLSHNPATEALYASIPACPLELFSDSGCLLPSSPPNSPGTAGGKA